VAVSAAGAGLSLGEACPEAAAEGCEVSLTPAPDKAGSAAEDEAPSLDGVGWATAGDVSSDGAETFADADGSASGDDGGSADDGLFEDGLDSGWLLSGGVTGDLDEPVEPGAPALFAPSLDELESSDLLSSDLLSSDLLSSDLPSSDLPSSEEEVSSPSSPSPSSSSLSSLSSDEFPTFS
jgi:hypothetical protein